MNCSQRTGTSTHFTAWGLAAATGAELLWRAPTRLTLPVLQVLADGSYIAVVINPKVRSPRRETLLAAVRNGEVPDPDLVHLVRVIEYDIPDRGAAQVDEGGGELIVLLSTITNPAQARADEPAATYHQQWEAETAFDQLKTHLRGPGKVLRSRLPDLVRQEIWAWLTVHYAISVLIARAAEAADIDPDRVSFIQTLRLIRRSATGTAAISP